jgi:hypothetical protein
MMTGLVSKLLLPTATQREPLVAMPLRMALVIDDRAVHVVPVGDVIMIGLVKVLSTPTAMYFAAKTTLDTPTSDATIP